MSTSDASTGLIYNVYGVYELAEAKDRAGNAFRGSEHGSGRSSGGGGASLQSAESAVSHIDILTARIRA